MKYMMLIEVHFVQFDWHLHSQLKRVVQDPWEAQAAEAWMKLANERGNLSSTHNEPLSEISRR